MKKYGRFTEEAETVLLQSLGTAQKYDCLPQTLGLGLWKFYRIRGESWFWIKVFIMAALQKHFEIEKN